MTGRTVNQVLTPRQRDILTKMAKHRDCPDECPNHEDGELVYDGHGRAFLGLETVAPRTLFALLRLVVISSETPMADIGTPGHLERYTINEDGERLLRERITDGQIGQEEK